jgi:hypothetical protein
VPKILLTDLSIRSLESENRLDFWDTKTPAIGIRVGPRSKTFIARLGAGRRALGNYPEISLQDARRAFLALKAASQNAEGLSADARPLLPTYLQRQGSNNPPAKPGALRM